MRCSRGRRGGPGGRQGLSLTVRREAHSLAPSKSRDARGPENRIHTHGAASAVRTVLVAEVPAFVPFSWHKPKRPLYILSTGYCPNLIFDKAMNMASFVDGHVSYTRMYWNGALGPRGVSCNYDPPAEYDYQWSEK